MFTRRAWLQSLSTALAAAQLPRGKRRPYLLFDSGQWPAIREKLSRQPARRIYENYTRRSRDVEPLILVALMTGERAAQQAAARAMMQSLRSSKKRGEILLSGEVAPHHLPRPGNSLYPVYDFSGLRYMHRLLNQYDVVDSFGVLTAEEKAEFRDHTVWMMDQYLSERILAINRREPDRRHNFHSDNLTNIATAALVFPDHPRAKEWLEYGVRDFAWQMEHSVEDGAWHEVPRYHGAVLRSLVPLAWALKRNAGIDFFENKGFRGLFDWPVRAQTPPDRVYGQWLMDGKVSGANGAETLAYPRPALVETPGVGDAEWVSYWMSTLAWAAPAYSRSDPKFAGRLMWAWDRAGGPYAPESNLLMAPLILIDPDLPRIPQTLSSEAMPKAGYAVLRADVGRPSEKYLFFNCGRRREEHWARHKHRDQNSFSLLAYGVPLSLDPGSGPYRVPDQELWHRATVSHSTVMFGGHEQQVEDGKILQFVSKPGADYLVADASRSSPCLQFYRHILFVKPDYFIVWDFIRSYVPSEWMLHTPAREISKTEHSIECATAWGVNLDVHVVLPKEPIETVEGEGRFGAWQSPQGRGVPPFTHQKYIRIRNAPNRDFLTVLHPRERNEQKIAVRLAGATENVLEISRGASRDYVLLFPVSRDFKDEPLGIAMKGRVGVVRPGGLTLVEGERLSFQGKEVTA